MLPARLRVVRFATIAATYAERRSLGWYALASRSACVSPPGAQGAFIGGEDDSERAHAGFGVYEAGRLSAVWRIRGARSGRE
jgi:hypothetical protein